MAAVVRAVHVPKNLHGKIIGAKGATIRDIESDYPGVKVAVPQRHEASDQVTLTGPPVAVKRAERRVLDIAGVLGDEVARERSKADELRHEKDKLFDDANRARDPLKRRQLFDEAHAKKRQLESEEQAAAKRIFRLRNSGYGLEQMDLHGLHLDEAMEQVRERLRLLQAGKVGRSVEIITGAGHHSDHKKAKLRPAVEELLMQAGLSYAEMQGGGGFKVYSPESMMSGAGEEQIQVQIEEATAGGFFGFFSMLFSCCIGRKKTS